MRNFKFILIGSVMSIGVIALIIIGINCIFSGFKWSDETRNMLYESNAPNKRFRIGVYNYDIGALGYSANQVSIVGLEEDYPIYGNVLRNRYASDVDWLSDEAVEMALMDSEDWSARVVISRKK